MSVCAGSRSRSTNQKEHIKTVTTYLHAPTTRPPTLRSISPMASVRSRYVLERKEPLQAMVATFLELCPAPTATVIIAFIYTLFRPRGRAPKGKEWDYASGKWVSAGTAKKPAPEKVEPMLNTPLVIQSCSLCTLQHSVLQS